MACDPAVVWTHSRRIAMPQSEGERGSCQGAELEKVGREWERGLERLSEGWEGRAREHKAFARRREVHSAGDLLRLVLGAAVLSMSLRLAAWWADQVGIGHLSDVAVGHRLRTARA